VAQPVLPAGAIWLLDWQDQLEILFIESFVETENLTQPDTHTQETMQNVEAALQILDWLKQAQNRG
jgi:hypothetical protein